MTPAKIMIAEDELIINKNIEKQLEKAGYKVIDSVVSGEEAIRQATKLRPDLILMDIRLAGDMDGVEAAEKIVTQLDIPVVFLTAYADDETLERAKVTAPFGYILKPFEPAKLRTTIEIALYKHQMERKLKESELRFRTLSASAPVGIFQTDTEGNCIYVNRRWTQISGIPLDQALGDGWVKGLHPDDRDSITKEWYRMSKNGENFSMEYRFLTPGGKISWVFGHAEPLKDDSQTITGYIGTITDISAKKRMEEEKLTGRKLEAIGILAGGIAHDFNNLLSVITGNVSMLKMDENLMQQQHLMLEHIETATSQATELAHKLITFSKGGWLSKKELSIADLIDDVIQSNFPNLRYQVHLNIDIPPKTVPIEGDEVQLKQVFFNLFQNAMEAVEDSSLKQIDISVRYIESFDDKIPLESGPHLKITFSDSGPGIENVHLDKVFDPYFTTKPMGSQKGLGLGLALCYSITRKHDGHIRIVSPTPQFKDSSHPGTMVEVFLPARKSKSAQETKSPEKEKAKSLGKVLVVDDDEIIQDVIAQMLKRLGYCMEVCNEGREAIRLYKEAMDAQEPFDILLVDLINKKGMGGLEALEALRNIDPGAPSKAIAISGFSDESDIQKLKNDGFIDVLFKPFKWKDLKQLLEKYFQNR